MCFPAEIKPNIYQTVQELALAAHQALGCRGVSRADFRYDDTPRGIGRARLSGGQHAARHDARRRLVPDMAAHAGMTFGELVRWMVEDASCDR